MSETTCVIDGCCQKAVARNWCRMHYARWRKHGDPGTADRQRLPAGTVCHVLPKAVPGQPAGTGCASLAQRKPGVAAMPGCSATGCDALADVRDLCGKHYQRVRSGKLDHPAAAEILRMEPCSVADCTRAAYSSGRCSMHNARIARTGEAGSGEPRYESYAPGQTCAYTACQRKPRARGYCPSHWRRLMSYGITAEQFEAQLAKQDGHCAICPVTEPGGAGAWILTTTTPAVPLEGL